jgi:predicted nucleic acid-binding protein
LILPDTTAWIELLRSSGSATHQRLRAAILAEEPIHVPDPVALEVLAGARPHHVAQTWTVLHQFPRAPVVAEDWEDAAAIYRRCRSSGTTPRSLMDCLIAAVAMRNDAEVLHQDRDFEAIARHTPLRLADV